MRDTRGGEMKEWKVPTPCQVRCDVTLDKTGHAWAGSMTGRRIAHQDEASGQFTVCLLMHSPIIDRVHSSDRGPRPVPWVGNKHGWFIVKLETLD